MSFLNKSLTVIISLYFLLSPINSLAQMPDLKLPQPKLDQGKSLREDIQLRYSNRSFDDKKALSLEEISTVLWATYGRKISSEDVDAVTSASYVIPSAGAIYALEIFVMIGKDSVESLSEGLYRYRKDDHSLERVSDVAMRTELSAACLGQKYIESAPISIIIAADFGSMGQRYGSKAERYVSLEAGHAAQNLYLMATDLGLTTVEVGAFMDEKIAEVLDIEYPVILIMPVGYKK